MLHLTALLALLLGFEPLPPEPARADDELEAPAEPEVVDAPLAESQRELLELAWRSVSAMPTVPHAKNRARAQEAIVAACLALEQPLRALDYAGRIDDWRRGTALADSAYFLARHGAREAALAQLERAAAVAERPDEARQQWRTDRVRAKVARVYWYLGQVELGLAFEDGLEGPELSELAEVRAENLPEGDLDSWMLRFDTISKALNFDQMRGLLDMLVSLYGRFYERPELRDRVEAKLKSSWENLPVQIRLELLMELIETSILRADSAKALELLEEALYVMEGVRWRLEDRIPMQAKLGELRFRAGDARRARQELDASLAMFESDPTAIIDVYRADALRPLAEAYLAVGEPALARAVYRRALEEGIHNPNGWPRAVDLAETCCSMAVRGFEPDEETWARLRELHGMLREPW